MAEQGQERSTLSGPVRGVSRLSARVACVTDVGLRRHSNQDNHLVLPLDRTAATQNSESQLVEIEHGGLMVAVADGMGGHFGGEVASRMCVENLAKEIVIQLKSSTDGETELSGALSRAVSATHGLVFAHAQELAEKRTMGTTLTAALLRGEHADLAQVGDSRAYLFRDGNLVLLTQDQTIGNQLRARGQDSAQIDSQIQGMLTQAVGAQADIHVVMTAVDLEPEDVLLLCSDGLYKVASPANIVDALELETSLHEKALQLVNCANAGGGPDNITVILAEICEIESAI